MVRGPDLPHLRGDGPHLERADDRRPLVEVDALALLQPAVDRAGRVRPRLHLRLRPRLLLRHLRLAARWKGQFNLLSSFIIGLGKAGKYHGNIALAKRGVFISRP